MAYSIKELEEFVAYNMSTDEMEAVTLCIKARHRQAAESILYQRVNNIFEDDDMDRFLSYLEEQHKPDCCLCGAPVMVIELLSEAPGGGFLCSTCIIHINDRLFSLTKDQLKQVEKDAAENKGLDLSSDIQQLHERLKKLDEIAASYF